MNFEEPCDAETKAKSLFLAALKSQESGNFLEAERHYRDALAIMPGRPSIQFNLSVVLFQLQRFAEARQLCELLIAAEPRNVAAQTHLGNCLARQNATDQALLAYAQALRLQPDHVEALVNRGNLLFKMGRFSEAFDDHDRALQLDPAMAEVHYNRGRVLREMQRPEEALLSYQQVKAPQGQFSDLDYDVGNVLLDLGRYSEAEACYQRAIKLQPDRAALWNALAVLRQEEVRLAEAKVCFEKALELDPQSPEVRYNATHLRLLCQEFEQAWPDYEYRFDVPASRATLRRDPESVKLFEAGSRWRGPQYLRSRSVAVWAEQGIGDQLLFSTLLPELIATGQSLVYEVDQRLMPAYQRAFPQMRFTPLGEPPSLALRNADAVVMAGSLPGMFRRKPADFAQQPRKLLSALPTRVGHYAGLLRSNSTKLSVALSWRSTRDGRQGREKSASLEAFAPLLNLPGVQFVDIQYGDTADERAKLARDHGGILRHFNEVDYFHDLEEVLAIIEACDLLITTSNANAHLAGILGKPVWLLYPGGRAPFHYWAHSGDHRCLWYPSMEIMAGPELPDWSSLVRFAVTKILRLTAVDD